MTKAKGRNLEVLAIASLVDDKTIMSKFPEEKFMEIAFNYANMLVKDCNKRANSNEPIKVVIEHQKNDVIGYVKNMEINIDRVKGDDRYVLLVKMIINNAGFIAAIEKSTVERYTNVIQKNCTSSDNFIPVNKLPKHKTIKDSPAVDLTAKYCLTQKLPGVSLSHRKYDDTDWPKIDEISLCVAGLRNNTVIQDVHVVDNCDVTDTDEDTTNQFITRFAALHSVSNLEGLNKILTDYNDLDIVDQDIFLYSFNKPDQLKDKFKGRCANIMEDQYMRAQMEKHFSTGSKKAQKRKYVDDEDIDDMEKRLNNLEQKLLHKQYYGANAMDYMPPPQFLKPTSIVPPPAPALPTPPPPSPILPPQQLLPIVSPAQQEYNFRQPYPFPMYHAQEGQQQQCVYSHPPPAKKIKEDNGDDGADVKQMLSNLISLQEKKQHAVPKVQENMESLLDRIISLQEKSQQQQQQQQQQEPKLNENMESLLNKLISLQEKTNEQLQKQLLAPPPQPPTDHTPQPSTVFSPNVPAQTQPAAIENVHLASTMAEHKPEDELVPPGTEQQYTLQSNYVDLDTVRQTVLKNLK